MAIKDINNWYLKYEISEAAKVVIDNVRNSEPARKVKSGGNNASGFYPSEKMGFTIQFESHKVELSGVYEKEFDKGVLEYYDQPPSFQIHYRKNNRKQSPWYTADFFVIEKDWVGWEEWKTEEELIRLSKDNPERYTRGQNGNWRCPPCERYAQQYGLSFRVRSSKDINWIFQNNIRFLEDYILDTKYQINKEDEDQIVNFVRNKPSIKLHSLFDEGFSPDVIYSLISKGKIRSDLYSFEINDRKNFPLFVDEETQKAFTNVMRYSLDIEEFREYIKLSIGEKFMWGVEMFSIISIQGEVVWLKNEQSLEVIDIAILSFHKFLTAGTIKGITKREKGVEENVILEFYKSATPSDLEKANHRFDILKKVEEGENPKDLGISDRTFRLWKKNFSDAEKIYGAGFIGLIPKINKRGNRTRRFPIEVESILKKVIAEEYETNKKKNMTSVYRIFCKQCEDAKLQPIHYKNFVKYIKKQPLHELISKREGKRAAYKVEEFYWRLDIKETPRHGDRPFNIVHIDHTELDIELICSETGANLKRPWITFMVDAYSRRILAFYLTYDKPSYRSNMMVIRELVRNHKRMPSTLVVDGGLDFNSVYFDTLLAANHVTKKVRPPAKARFGSVIERLFGTVHREFIYNLLGNTQATKKDVRQVTKKFNPKYNAVWTLEDLYKALKVYIYDIYENQHHSTLGTTPLAYYNKSLSYTGLREFKFITDFEAFKFLTFPSTKKGTAKVQPGAGVKIHGFYYWNDMFRSQKYQNTQVKVRFDPFNIGEAYAYLNNSWTKLISEHYTILKGRTLKEIQMASEELRKRNKIKGIERERTTKELVDFLTSLESQELLELQRLKDKANKKVVQSIMNAYPPNNQTEIDQKPLSSTEDKNNSAIDKTILEEVDFNDITGFGVF